MKKIYLSILLSLCIIGSFGQTNKYEKLFNEADSVFSCIYKNEKIHTVKKNNLKNEKKIILIRSKIYIIKKKRILLIIKK